MRKSLFLLLCLVALMSCATVGNRKINALEVIDALTDDDNNQAEPAYESPTDKRMETEKRKQQANANDSVKRALLRYKR